MEKTITSTDIKTTRKIKRNIDIIKEYISSQPEKIKKLENFSINIKEVYPEFINLTRNYSNKIISLATKFKPESTSLEGQLVQAIQSLLLFYSDSLNNFADSLQNEINKQYNQKQSIMLSSFGDFRKIYYDCLKKQAINYENYRKECELYQEFLVSIEYLDFERDSKEKRFSKRKSLNFRDNIPFFEKDFNLNSIEIDYSKNAVLNLNDNKKEVIEAQKIYLQSVQDSNNTLKKLLEYLIAEKTLLIENLYNNCVNFIQAFLTCVSSQHSQFETQKNIILNLANSIKVQKDNTENYYLRPVPIKLEFLDIYSKSKDFIDLENKTTISSGSADDKVNSNIKNYNKCISDSPNLANYSIEYIENYNYRRKVLKSMVLKLDRNNILNIVEKLKEIKLFISEQDLNTINIETNIKKIKDILRILFHEPEKLTENNKNDILKLLTTDKTYLNYFLKILNNHRTKAHCIITEKIMNHLGSIFKVINDLILKEKNLKLIKIIIMLSMTYYYISKNENEEIKHYLFSYINEHPDYKKKQFWEDYLTELIKYDLDSKEYGASKILETKKSELSENDYTKISYSTFSNILTITKNMSEFKLKKSFVKNFIETIKEKFPFTNQQVENVYLIMESYEFVKEDEEEKKKEGENSDEKK